MSTDDDNQANTQGAQDSIGHASGPVSQNFGQQTNIDTAGGPAILSGGGDVAMGNIDKRQGTFLTIQPTLPPALHQLRAPVGDFVGREQEIDELVQALSNARGAAAAISGVRGMGGIGKTELAYTVAQRLNEVFPDVQLLIELRGASNTPLTPEQALQIIIRAFEREAKLPDDLGQLKGIYSSVLSGKRALILADDAKDAAQVRPLLPPPGCVLFVTSRNRFSLPGMAALDLGTLPPAEAERLLLEIWPRIGSYAAELARLCGYLPLALRISAGVLATNDSRDVARYLAQLQIERLKHLSDPDDPQASVEASLQLSYDALSPTEQEALCQLSVFPASFDLAAALAVVESDGDVSKLLELLRRRSLLEWDAALERSSLHELVQAFVVARLVDADAVRLRHARHYAQVASGAQFDLYLNGNPLAGLRTFDTERPHIDAGWGWAMAHAGDEDADALLLNYPNALYAMADLRYDRQRERISQSEAQLAAARRRERRADEGYALGNLGNVYRHLGDARKAITFHEQAFVIQREIGNRRGEGYVMGNLGQAYHALGEIHRAIDYYEQRLVIVRELGQWRSEAWTLGNLGRTYYALGEIHRAIDYYEQDLAITRKIGDRDGEGIGLGNLGQAYHTLGEIHRAIDYYEQALAIVRELGERRGEGTTLSNLGNAYKALGDVCQAITYYEQQMVVAGKIGDRQGISIASWNLGLALQEQNQLARAAELIQVCVDYERDIGHPDAEKHAVYLEHLRQRLVAESSTTPADQTTDG